MKTTTATRIQNAAVPRWLSWSFSTLALTAGAAATVAAIRFISSGQPWPGIACLVAALASFPACEVARITTTETKRGRA